MRKRCFIDLDRTLYRTHELVEHIRQDLLASGSDAAEIDRHLKELSATGYSFEEHLARLGYAPPDIARKAAAYHDILANGDDLLFPDVAEVLASLSKDADLFLLTYGVPDHQKAKFCGIASLQRSFAEHHFVWTEQSKGDIIRGYGEHPATWFLDDSVKQLKDVLEKAPWARCVRMCWPESGTEPHAEDDDRWFVVTDLAEFVTLVENT